MSPEVLERGTERCKALLRRLPPFPIWLLMGLSWLSVALAVVVFLDTGEEAQQAAKAEKAQQYALQERQVQAMEALTAEVRQLRTLLEERTP